MEGNPLKSDKLKIVDHVGIYYATFDGSQVWKIDKWLFRLLMMCDGKKSFEDIALEITKISGFNIDDIRVGLKPIFEELKSSGFIEFT